ncbi:hypothetical protein [Synechocystis sp. PCC 7509]|nr:hypothetical protein [Synechocystis sp. PCC 7509]
MIKLFSLIDGMKVRSRYQRGRDRLYDLQGSQFLTARHGQYLGN